VCGPWEHVHEDGAVGASIVSSRPRSGSVGRGAVVPGRVGWAHARARGGRSSKRTGYGLRGISGGWGGDVSALPLAGLGESMPETVPRVSVDLLPHRRESVVGGGYLGPRRLAGWDRRPVCCPRAQSPLLQ
jgi:hypothetical protein